MSINSLQFLLFLLAAVCLYYLVPKRTQWWVLLAASVWFYLCYSPKAACYLAVTVLLTYGAGLALAAIPDKKRRRPVLAAALALNFAALALFKYSSVWLAGFSRLLGFTFRPLELLLPLGISFYIFQSAGYLMDVYRGKLQPERNLAKYALFVCYFPQMIQGPIHRFSQLQPQLLGSRGFSADRVKYGIQLMLWGMLKKVFLADTLAAGVRELYGNYAGYSGALVLLGAALYCVQLYADFSGGTDIVRGASSLFGVELAENFRRPYFAQSVDDFWKRWHISLGDWMKDYLFYPLALSRWMGKLGRACRGRLGARAGKLLGPCLSTVLVFLAVGLWQGPGWCNVVYGLWNGLLMSGAMVFQPRFARWRKALRLEEKPRTLRALRTARTCLLVVIGRYFSNSATLSGALGMLRQTVTRFAWNLTPGALLSFGLSKWDYLKLLVFGGVLLCVSLRQEKGVEIRKSLERRPAAVQFLLTFAAVALLTVFVYLNRDYTAIAYVYENV